MKTTKKLFALILALMMVVSIAMPVMATDVVDHSNHKITITGAPDAYKYEAHQIFDGEVAKIDVDNNPNTPAELVLTDVNWGANVDAKATFNWPNPANKQETISLNLLQALQSPVINPTSYQLYAGLEFADPSVKECANAICDVLSNNNSTANGLVFADIVANYLTGEGVEDVDHVISGLTDGYYLVADITDKDDLLEGAVRSLFMLRLVEDAIATPKISDVSVDKKLIESDTTSVSGDKNIGDVVKFEIRGETPDRLEEYDTFYYAFRDIMSEGLELDKNSIKVYTVNNGTTTEITHDGLYRTVFDEDGVTLSVIFDDLLAVDRHDGYTVQGTTVIVLTYEATVTEAAVLGSAGNKNSIHLEYSNNPHTDEKGITKDKDVYVYTFGLDVTKIDGKTKAGLSGAEFVLYRARQGGNQYAIVELNEDTGAYVVTGWTGVVPTETVQAYRDAADADKVAKKAEVEENMGCTIEEITFVSGDDGNILIEGLDTDRYWLLETKAPTGYELDKSPKDFTISATYTAAGALDTLTMTPYGSDPVDGNKTTGFVSFDFVNNAGNTLPETGGIGTTLFYVFGGVMAAGALILLITKKRMAA